jgi:hypothetical protein
MFRLGFLSGGRLYLAWCPTGSYASLLTADSTDNLTALDAVTIYWLNVTLDVNNGAGGYEVKFWWSADQTNDSDAVTWTQLGTTITGGATTNLAAVTQPVLLGAVAVSINQVYRAQQMASIGGAAVVDVDFTDRTALVEPYTTFLEGANGATVTINRSATGKPATVVDRPLLVGATDDYTETAA